MMPETMRPIFCLPLLLTAGLISAEEINGTWQGMRPMGGSRTEPVTLRFAFKDGRLAGSLRTGYGEVPIERPTWDGRSFRFLSHMTFRPYEVEDDYSGTISGDALEFTVVRNGSEKRSGTARRTSLQAEPYVRVVPRSTPPHRPLPPDGQALKPPMGWNSWNHFETRVDDATVRAIADALVSSGLRDAGYVYVNIDDGWQGERGDDGELHPNRHFHDMAALAAYVHSKGLKFGIYSSPGPKTCAGYEGSWGHEEQDARMYAGWGVDYLKHDWCSGGLVWQLEEMGDAYAKMARALRATGRPVVYSLCQYGLFNVWEWGAAAGGHLWRTTGDIGNSWGSLSQIAFSQDELTPYAGPGHWNDPDMLEVGNGGLNIEESRSHMALWAMLSAPLLLGNDLRKATPETLGVLGNREVIAIDQDSLGKPARRVARTGQVELWVRSLSGGDWAVAAFNRGETPSTAGFDWRKLGLPCQAECAFTVRELWHGAELDGATAGIKLELAPHGCALLRVTPRH